MSKALIAFSFCAIGIPIFADRQINLDTHKVSIEEWDQTIYVGEEFSVGNLAAWGSTGYHWNWLIEEKQPIEFVRSEVNDLNYKPMPGSPPPDTDYFFKTTKPGEFTLRFIHTGPGIIGVIGGFKIIHVQSISKTGDQKKHMIAEAKNRKEYAVTFPAKTITEVEPSTIEVSVGDTFSVRAAKGHCSFLSWIKKEEEKNIELLDKSTGKTPEWNFKAKKTIANECLPFMNIKYNAKGTPIDVLGRKVQCVKIKG